jgi:prepilin-type N-terminal cleavage/methylation domain-containing protein
MMRARLADERGFSLVELLAALVVGAIVLFAAFALLDTGVRLQAKSVDSLDATDRGRIGIDQISQALASRICLGTQPSLVDARDDRVEFYASLAPESSAVRLVVQRRVLDVLPIGIRERVWTASPPEAPPSVPPATTTPATTSRIVVQGVKQTQTTPYFRYYANQGAPAEPTLQLSTPLSTLDRSRVARIEVAFTAQGKRADVGTDLSNEILNRSATCIA